MKINEGQIIIQTTNPDIPWKSVGAIYLFTAEQIYNIVISPIRTSRFAPAVFVVWDIVRRKYIRECARILVRFLAPQSRLWVWYRLSFAIRGVARKNTSAQRSFYDELLDAEGNVHTNFSSKSSICRIRLHECSNSRWRLKCSCYTRRAYAHPR